MTHLFNSIAITFVFLFSCIGTAQSAPFPKGISEKITPLIEHAFDENKTGGALAIIKNGEVSYTHSRGLANIEHHIPITDSTIFNIASVSKQFTTYLALMLEDEGKLSLQDDIRDLLPELKDLPHLITIQELMTHTHGLPNVDELSMLLGKYKMTHDEVLTMLFNIEHNNFIPGDDYQYNNTGYVLLSEIIERVGNAPFEEQLTQKIFAPLGMMNTMAIGNHDEVIPNKAYSYSKSNDSFFEQSIETTTMGASGIYTSLNDLTLWAINYQNTTLGKASFFTKMQERVSTRSNHPIQYGLGLQVENYKGIDIVFHGGGTASYCTYVLHAPAYDLSLVLVSNTGDFSGYDLIYQSLEKLLENELIMNQEQEVIHTEKKLKELEGVYELFPGNYFPIKSKGDKLYLQPFGTDQLILLPTIDTMDFLFPEIPNAKLTFSSGRFDLRIGDFIYPAERVFLERIDHSSLDLNAFTGTFINDAHNIQYDLSMMGETLVAFHPVNGEIPLFILNETTFYSNYSFFGKLNFIRDSNGQIVGFDLSGQNLKNIRFKKA